MNKTNYVSMKSISRIIKFKTFIVCSIMFLATIYAASAQLVNVPVSGYNNDIIANNGSATSNTATTGTMPGVTYPTIGTDGNGPGAFTLVASDYKWWSGGASATCGLVSGGTINSALTSGLGYVLQSTTANNVLSIASNTYIGSVLPTSGTLTLATPAKYTKLYVLYESVLNSGAPTITATITFTDASTQVITGNTIVNWFTNGGNVAYSGNMQRANNVAPGTLSTCAATGPYLFEMGLPLSAANYNKFVQTVSFSFSNAAGTSVNSVDYFHVMALGGLTPCTTPADQPTAITQGATTTNSIAGSFTGAASSPTGYLVVGYPTGASTVTPVNGTTYVAGQAIGTGKVIQASALTSFTATGLTGATTYDVFVYSYNTGATCGGPQYNNTVTPSANNASWSTSSCGGVAGGTYSVGPTGTYASLTAAMTAINAGITGPVILELQAAYISSVETFPIAFPSNSCIGPINTLTIRPETGATALSITGASATGILNFTAAAYVTIDGRSGGVGVSQLTISNTGTGYAAQFTADALFNTIKYCTITSRNLTNTSGTIVFGTGTIYGNDANTIDNCNISDDGNGTTFPANAIYSAGTSAAIDNSSNIISNCNISNYFSATLATNGILLTATGNSAWTISNNRLFQTANRTYTTGNAHNGISVQSGSGYTITGNTIGFANSSGTGTTNMAGAAAAISGFPGNYAAVVGTATSYTGINATFSSGGIISLIQSNTIAGFALFTSTGGGAAFTGINVATGNVTIGGASAGLGNTIGSTSGQSSIYLATTTNGGAVFVIRTSPATGNTAIVQNNTMGAIDAVGTTATLVGSFVGIDGSGVGNIVNTNNTIGNATADNIRTGYTTLSGVTATNLSNAGLFVAAGTTGTTATMTAIRSTNTGQSYNASSNTIRGMAMNATVTTALGITSAGAMTGSATSVTINSNAIGTSGLGWMRYVAANSGVLTGISMTNTIVINHSVQNNDFQGIVYSVAGSGAHTYITCNGGTSSGDVTTIANNTFTNLNVNTTGSVTFISHGYTVPQGAIQTINNNTIVTAFNKGGAGGTVTCMTSGSSTVNATAIVSHTNNNFSNITVTGATILNGIANTDGLGTTALNRTVTGNTFNNWIGGTSAITVMSYAYWGGTTSTLSNNTITSITGQSSIVGINIANSGLTANPLTIATNTITGLSSTGTGGNVTGLTCANASPIVNINSNTINALSSSGASAVIIGLGVTGAAITNVNDNRITGLSGTGTTAPTANGILVSGGTTVNLNRNKICDIAENGTFTTTTISVIGISITGGITVTAFSNIIGDLRTPATSNADAIRGISVTGATVNTSFNIYNNTVYLAASSTGAAFGTTGIYHTANATATTAKLDLRNNIIVNNSSNIGGGISSALRRSAAATLGNYATTSNNNLYYAGVPSATNAILNDNGTVYGTAAAAFAFGPVGTAGTFQNFVTASRESASFTEVVSGTPGIFFQSTSCASSNFLHIVNGLTSQIESGGLSPNIVTYATDYDGDIRAGSAGYLGSGTNPDLGADEFAGITPAPSISGVTITPLGTQCVATNRNVAGTITTTSGTVTGAVINYSYNGIPQTPITMTNTSGNIWQGIIPAATTPTNATVTWNIVATNSISLTITFNGTSYSDDPMLTSCSFISSSSSTVCSGSPVTLTATVLSPSSTLPTYVNHAGASSALTDEDITQVSIYTAVDTALHNPSTFESLTGTIGTATGVAGGYSNFTSFGPFNLTAGNSYIYKVVAFDDIATYFANAFAIYIDYNRNGVFTDAGELVFANGTTVAHTGTHIETASFTVPASAMSGITRMRVMLNEGVISSPTQAISFGEVEDYSINIISAVCGSAMTITNYSWSDGSTNVVTGNPAIVNPSSSTTYTVTYTNTTGCTKTNSVTINVNPLPAAPTATPSTQCGSGIPLAYVTSTSGLGGPQFNWYSASSAGTLLQTPPLGIALAPYYSNNFSSATLTNSSIGGAAAISGGALVLQPTITSTGGSITVNPSGINSSIFQTDFDFSLTATGTTIADGFSYSFADDAVPSYNIVPTAEHGSGSKLRLCFMTFNAINGGDGKGIYLVYNTAATTGYTVATPGVLAYSTDVSWIPVAAGTVNTHITASINALGQLTLIVGANTIFNNVQLPAGYLSANRSTWKHIISSRSGGIAGGFSMDNLVIQANTYAAGSTTYLTSINTPSTFYITEKDPLTGCESAPRTQLVAGVTFGDNVAPVAQISAANITQLCIGGTFELSTLQTGVNLNNYTYTWTAASTNSGITGSVAGGTFASPTTVNVTPLAAGTYIYTVSYTDGVCNGSNTISIVVNPLPFINSAVASPSPICDGSTTTLTALTQTGGPLNGQIGTAATTSTSQPSPYYTTWWGNKNQYLIRATELTAAGFSAGNISRIGFNLGSVSTTLNLTDFTIKMGHTVLTVMPATFQSGLTTVYTNASYSVIANANTITNHTFSIPFAWDGVSNIIIETCFNNNNWNGSQTVSYSVAPFVSSIYYNADAATVCSAPGTPTTSSNRPNMYINGTNIVSGAGTYNWQWNPGAINSNVAVVTPPVGTTTYAVTATNPATGCVNTATASVTVNPLPLAPTSANSPSTQCGYAIPTVAVADPNGFLNPTFKWYSAATLGTLLQSSTSATYTTEISASTTFYVSVINPSTGCESARFPVVANVTAFDPISITANALTCVGTPNAFGISQTGTTNVYQYTWSANPVSGSGVIGTPTGSNPSFTAVLSGNYVYAVTGTETGTGCVAKASKNVTVYQGLTGTATATQILNCVYPTGLITTNVSGAGTVVNNDFSSSTLPSYMTLYGTPQLASITGGELVITPNLAGKSGSVMIQNTTGLANNDFQIDFDFITKGPAGVPFGPTAADGLSYSYGDDVVAGTYQNVANAATNIGYPSGSPIANAAECGSGTKLKISFDPWNNGAGTLSGINGGTNYPGIYFMYNCTDYFNAVQSPTGATANDNARGILAFSPATWWSATSTQTALPVNTTHVTIVMAGAEPGYPNGSTTLSLSGTTGLAQGNVYGPVKVALPPGYLTADKSTWKHVFAARTGGNFEGHSIDNLSIRYNNFYEYSINGGTSWSQTTPIIPPTSGTYSVDARYVSVPGCFTNLGSVTINTPVFTTSSSANNSCVYSTSQPTLSFTPSFPGATYQWDSAATGSNNWGAIAGATSATYTLPFGVYLNNTDFRCNVLCGGVPTPGSPSSTQTVLVYSPVVSTTTPGTRCGIGTVDLNATTLTSGATLRWYAAATGGSAIGIGPLFTTPNIAANTSYYVSAEIGSGGSGTAVFGAGTLTNSNTTYPSPLGTYYGGARHQMLILASELSAQGLTTGSLITGLKFDVAATNSANPMQSYTINMKGTSASSLTSTFETGLTEVVAASIVSSVVGLNTFNFNTSNFVWNGTDNIIVETIYNNNDLGTSTNGNCSVKYTTQGFTCVNYSRIDNGGAGLAPIYALASTSTSADRPNIQLVYSGGCPSPRTAVLATVTAAPPVTISSNATICESDSILLSASSIANDPNYTYSWNPGGFTGANYKVAPAATTTYTLTALDNSGGLNNNCQDIQTVTIAVNQRPVINSLTASTPIALCQGDSAQISLVTTPFIPPSGNYTVASAAYATQACPSLPGPTGDDAISITYPIGFNFNYYGTTYSQFAISTNGNIQLGDGSGTAGNPAYSTTFTATNLPTATAPNNMIALCWADLTSSAGNITYGTSGVSPNQKLIVCYNNILWLNGSGNLTGQIIISEGSTDVEIVLTSVTATTGNRVCGVENATGTLGTMAPGRGPAIWTTSNERWIFSAPVNSSLTYAWTPAASLSNGAAQNPKAAPSGNTVYTVTVNETGTGCSRSATLLLNVTPVPKPYISTSDTAVCSTTSELLIEVNDSGAYAGGYPFGTTIDFVGYSGATLDSTYLLNSTGDYYAIVKLPINIYGGCTDTTDTSSISFGGGDPFFEAPQITLETDSVKCKGESTGSVIGIVSFGGNPTFRYQWYDAASVLIRDTVSANYADTLSGQPAGFYYLNVIDHQDSINPPYCQAQSYTIYISEPDLLTISAVKTNPSSVNPYTGTITTTTNGGTAYYTYLWNDGAITQDRTGILGGTYTVTVTDSHGCTASTSITLTYECSISAVNQVVQQASCYKDNGIMTIVPSGGSFYTYHWYTSPVQTTATAINLAYGYNSYCLVTDTVSGCSIMDTVIVPTSTSGLSITMTSPTYLGGKNIRCNGDNNGSINVAVTGSTGPYTYAWSNGGGDTSNISNLLAGTYTVTVSNGGCTSSNTIILTQPAALLAVTSSTNATCGVLGTAAVTVSGGTASYTYSWNTIPAKTTATITGLTAGSYTVTVSDANGCTKSGTVIITAATGFPVTGVITNVKCYGGTNGTITITTGGGTAPYTYLWSNGSTVKNQLALAAGTYTVTATDSKGCSGQYSGTVTQPALLTLVGSATNVSCFGGVNGTATVVAAGGTPAYTYSWNTVPVKTTATATGLKSGSYLCTVKDANLCVKIFTVTITQPAALLVTVNKTNVTTFGGNNGTASALPSGGVAAYTYLWSNAKTTQTITGLIAGTYNVTVTDSKGCTKTGSAVITQPASRMFGGVTPTESNSVVFPNPTSGKTTVSFDETIRTKVSLIVFSMKGEKVFEKQFNVEENANSFDLDLSRLPKGIYSIRYRTNDKDWIDKLVIQ